MCSSRPGLVLFCSILLFIPGEALAQRGGHGGGGHAGGGYHSAAPSRSYYYSPRPALPGGSTMVRPGGALYLTGSGGVAVGRSFGDVNRGVVFIGAMNRFNRPWHGNYVAWYYGSWNNWAYYPAFWAELPGGSWLAPWGVGGAFDYANPYWQGLPGGDEGAYVPDYSSPIPVPSEKDLASADEKTVNAAMAHFAKAREYFKNGQYSDATSEVDRGIQLVPGDRTMHEFRGLTLFARKMYGEAAGTIYAVLSAGPGWNWNTMAQLYDKTETYTRQLRNLEGFIRDNPKDGKARFLLAYHYLVIDARGPAINELRAAARLTPKDKLSALLADALEKERDKK